MHERSKLKEKFVCCECGPNWPGARSLQESLPDHNVEELLFCPSWTGWAIGRKRKWAFANKYKVLMTFKQFCVAIGAYRTCMWSGTEFWCEDEATVRAALVKKAKRHGNMEHDIEADGWMAALSGAQRVYLQTAREMRIARNQKLQTWQPFWIVDLEHRPQNIDRSSKHENVRVPCLLRHASYWLEVERPLGSPDTPAASPASPVTPMVSRLLLKREIMSLQGLQTIPEAHGDRYLLPWYDEMVNSFSERDVTSLAGNAMHAEIVLLAWLWFLSCSIIDDPDDV
jgi:hypothetical protein